MSLEKIDALEDRISRVVGLVKDLKEQKTRLEGEVARMREELASKKPLEDEVGRLRQEKDLVKERLEKILKGIEELAP